MWFVRKAKTWIGLAALQIYRRNHTDENYRTIYNDLDRVYKKAEEEHNEVLALIDKFKEDFQIILKLMERATGDLEITIKSRDDLEAARPLLLTSYERS